ncbi:MAG TPA: hypothetical protein VGN42_24045 [Pirellulales bacterium]|jgi:hypothetical protein|nr:hypothetical protein [Pirellulales bacterium]
MTAPMVRARPRAAGRLILRRLFDAAHARPRPHLFLQLKPPGAEPSAAAG